MKLKSILVAALMLFSINAFAQPVLLVNAITLDYLHSSPLTDDLFFKTKTTIPDIIPGCNSNPEWIRIRKQNESDVAFASAMIAYTGDIRVQVFGECLLIPSVIDVYSLTLYK